jgi:arginase
MIKSLKNSFTLCPIFIGQKLYGPCQAPKILSKKLSQIKTFDNFETYKLKFQNAYHECDHHQNLKNVLRYNTYIYQSNIESLDKHKLNINIGGDHSVAIGSVSASLNKYKDDLTLIWIDAHADINSLKSSSSKNIHGMPLNILTDKSQFSDWTFDKLKYKQIIYIGLRDIDDYEVKLIDDEEIKHWSSYEINNLDYDPYSRFFFLNSLKRIIKDTKIHLSLDVDALDPEYIPCTGISVENGLTMDFVTDIISNFKEQIVNADITELNLDLKTEADKEKSINNTIEIIKSFI